MDRLPTDKRAIRGSQEDNTRRNLRWLPRPSHRTRKLLHRLLRHGRGDKRRPHRPRRYRVDSDPLPNDLVAQTPREGHNCALGRGIVEEVWAPDVGVYAGVVDDGAAEAHVREGVFREVEERVDVGVECSLPLVPVLY